MFAACSRLFSIIILFSIIEVRMVAFNLESSEIHQRDRLDDAIEASIEERSLGKGNDIGERERETKIHTVMILIFRWIAMKF